MHKLKIKSIHPINKSNHQINNPPPTSGDERRHPPPFAAHLRRTKKKDPATGGGRDPPQWPGGEIRPPSVASLVNQPRKKKSGEPKKIQRA
jgi:hypothetical protein